jgi:transposase-like protein
MGLFGKIVAAKMGKPTHCPSCGNSKSEGGPAVKSAGSWGRRGKTEENYWLCESCGYSWSTC